MSHNLWFADIVTDGEVKDSNWWKTQQLFVLQGDFCTVSSCWCISNCLTVTLLNVQLNFSKKATIFSWGEDIKIIYFLVTGWWRCWSLHTLFFCHLIGPFVEKKTAGSGAAALFPNTDVANYNLKVEVRTFDPNHTSTLTESNNLPESVCVCVRESLKKKKLRKKT